jgi:hypothetical protein
MKMPSAVRNAAAPILTAAFPIVSLYSQNSQYSLEEVGTCLAWAAAGGLGTYLLLYSLFRDGSRAALLALPAIVIFFLYGAFSTPFASEAGQEVDEMRVYARGGLELLYALLWIGFGAMVLVARRWRPLETLARVASIIVACIVAVPVVVLAPAMLTRLAESRPALATPAPTPATAPLAGEPDIYYLVLDSYARQDILRLLYDVDNADFLDGLRARGFFVADRSRANYLQTHLSLASSLNFRYIDDAIEPNGRVVVYRNCYGLVQNSEVSRVLKGRGYTYVNVSSGYWLTSPNVVADVEVRDPDLDLREFQRTIVEMTPLKSWPGDTGIVHRQRIMFGLNSLPEIAARGDRKFVFAHLVCPHPPFVYTRDGDAVARSNVSSMLDARSSDLSEEQYKAGYREQVLFLNKRLLEVVDGILAQYPPERRPVIVLQGDHGTGVQYDWQYARLSYLPDRASILMAVLPPPDRHFDLSATMTPVNLFRVVFNGLFDAQLPLLPDRTFFVPWDTPAAYTELPVEALDPVAVPPASP